MCVFFSLKAQYLKYYICFVISLYKLLNYTFGIYEFLYNRFYGFAKKKCLRQGSVLFCQVSSYYYITINVSVLVITVDINNI